MRDERGEYLRLADWLGGTIVTFDRRPGFGTVINPLDPHLVAAGSEDTTVGQDELLLMCAEVAVGYKLVDTIESSPAYALREAHKAALRHAHTEGRTAVLQDVINALYVPDVSAIPGPVNSDGSKILADIGVTTLRDLALWGRPVATALERYTTGDLSGLISGETQTPDGHALDLSSNLIVFDTSALPEGSAALGLVVGVMATYIQAVWSSVDGDKYLLNEEAYFTDRLVGVPQIMRELAKRGRGRGLSVVTFFHRLSDFPQGSDLWALVKEADVAHIFRQPDQEEAEAVCRMWSLDVTTYAGILTSLPQGTHLLLVQSRPPEQVQHIRTKTEEWLTNTDQAMDGLPQPKDEGVRK